MQLRHHLAIVGLGWTIIVVLSAAFALRGDRADMLEQSRIAARTAIERDILYRHWSALSGGLYVEVSDTTQPNPYLDGPERDQITLSGKRLTLVNPAYMTRQAFDLQQATSGVQGHITSLRPIRPENSPDDWERAALLAFERGQGEVSSLEDVRGQTRLRLIRPLLVEAACLKCHARQSYAVGEVRGGISVTVPMSAQLADFGAHSRRVLGAHAFIWALGLAGVAVGGRRLSASLREAEEARARSEAASLAKSEFLANMSHELRTPLNGALGLLQLLKVVKSPEEQTRYADLAYDSGHKLLGLLNDILDFVRLDSGQPGLACLPFSPREIFGSVEQVFRTAPEQTNTALACYVDESVPACLQGDEARLRQALFNLVGNALKFTTAGSVRVDVWARPSKRQPGRTRLYLSVNDTGIGISDDKLNLVFEHFTQAEAGLARRYSGAGLGLAIVRRIVEAMDGGISVDTELGRGTTVYLHVLLKNCLPEQAAAGSAPRPDATG